MLGSTVSIVSAGGVWDGWSPHWAGGAVDVDRARWNQEENIVLVEADLPPVAMDPMMMVRASQHAV